MKKHIALAVVMSVVPFALFTWGILNIRGDQFFWQRMALYSASLVWIFDASLGHSFAGYDLHKRIGWK